MTKEEAIKIVRENMHLSYDEGHIFEALKILVPELAESEDEMVRKELFEVIKHCYEDGGYALCTDDYKKYSAYLEKQKEKNPTDRAFIFDDVLALESAMALAKDDKKLHGALKSIFERVHDAYHGEQQPAEWSEENEKIMEDIIFAIREVW